MKVRPSLNAVAAPIFGEFLLGMTVAMAGLYLASHTSDAAAGTFGLTQQVLETLSPREAGVIKMRYGLEDGQPKTLDDIGRVYGVTRERIRQIESKTMSKLRHPSRSQTLRDFLDQ